MRILHTSDLHAGKKLYGQDRTEELSRILDEMVRFVKESNVDIVLICGDIYETYNPPANAIEVVNEFFLKLYHLKVFVVLITGNHDNSRFFESMKNIFRYVNIIIVDKPKRDITTVKTRNDEVLNIAPLPYPSERQLLRLVDVKSNQREKYADSVRYLLNQLSSLLPSNGINIIMAHMMIDKSIISGSERPISVSEHYAVKQTSIPKNVMYAALGHVHKFQKISDASVEAYYSGSPMQLNFGETNDNKGFILIDLFENKLPEIEFVKLPVIRELMEVSIERDKLDNLISDYKNYSGFLKVRILLEHPERGLSELIRREIPSVLAIEVDEKILSSKNRMKSAINIIDPVKAYTSYYEHMGKNISDKQLKLFRDIVTEVEENDETD